MSERTTWVEVRRDALEQNFRSVAEHAGVPVCAVVKGNAYGAGLVEAARVFASCGAAMLAVTRLEEARALRDAGVETPILLMMPAPDQSEAVKLGCEITVGSLDDLGALPGDADVHLKIDTGIGRLGVRPGEALEVARAIASRARLRAVWTHFADAAGSGGPGQLTRFTTVVGALRADGIECEAHAANSAALLALPASRFDMVRIGTLLYGQHPIGARAPWATAEAVSWYARVAAVRAVPGGTPVGYGSEWTARADARIATLPVGYVDGFGADPNARTPTVVRATRTLANVAMGKAGRWVAFEGRRAPVVGRVAMHVTTVDVTALPDVAPGSVATLPGRRMMISPSIERIVT
jgi:alanine racemase